MSKKDAKAGFGRSLWNLFASVKLALVLLLALAVFSILGTLIQQNQPPEFYQQMLGAMSGPFLALGLHDMYHAPWFLALLAMLAANIIVCSLDRLPLTLRLMRVDPAKELGKGRQPEVTLSLAVPPARAAAQAREALAKIGRVHGAEHEGTTTLFAQRGAWSRLGVYVVHLSVLVIYIGAIIGLLWGYEGVMQIPQGGRADAVTLDRGGRLPLPFSVKLDKFVITYYPNGDVSEYRSTLSFIKDGKVAETRDIIVNDPASFDDISFNQAFYGYELTRAKLRIGQGDDAQVFETSGGGMVRLPGGGTASFRPSPRLRNAGGKYQGEWGRLMLIMPGAAPRSVAVFGPGSPHASLSAAVAAMNTHDEGNMVYLDSLDIVLHGMGEDPLKLTFRPDGPARQHLPGGGHVWLTDFNPLMRMGDFYQGPMVRLSVMLPGVPAIELNAFQSADGAAPPPPVTMLEADLRPFTGLQVKYDPGVWLVFVGFTVIIIGLVIAFYFAHQKVWITVAPAQGGCTVAFAGGANKNKSGLKLALRKMADKLQSRAHGGSE